MRFLKSLPVLLTLVTSSALAQAPSASQVIGEVTDINNELRQISLGPDKGEPLLVAVTDTTVFRRVPAGAVDLTTAVRIAFSEVGKGDRIMAIGQRSEDQKRLDARSVIVMTRSDLTQKQQQDQEAWRKHGIYGTVSAVDPAAGAFTVKSGTKAVIVHTTARASEVRRYAPDSVKYSDARPASLEEIRVGDQARVLGDKSEDGASMAAERIIFGSFRQIAATINSINATSGELVIKDLGTRKNLTVRVNSESTMKKLPPPMAAALARRYQQGSESETTQAVRGGAPAPAPTGGAPGGAAGAGDVGQMLDRLPAMLLAELKPGDAIMLSSTTGADPSRVTAVMLLAGVEPLLTASPNATRDIMGGWNVGGGSPGDGQ